MQATWLFPTSDFPQAGRGQVICCCEHGSGRFSMNEIFLDQPPDETTLLQTSSATPYLKAVIGKRDLFLSPMVPAGSTVQIDTSKREISPKRVWTDEFQRPIYFLKTKDGYFCGWCEVDDDSQWLILTHHPLSPSASGRLRYPTEVQILGRVVTVTTPLGR
jgi:hypothetical protein